MIIGDLSRQELAERLANRGLGIQFGPFNLSIRSDLASYASLAHQLYEPYPLLEAQTICDFHVQITKPRGLRRWLRPQACFALDGQFPFAPYAVEQAFPALELGIN